MLNVIWLTMMSLSFLTALLTGRLNELVASVTSSAKLGFEIALGLTGVMALWLGIMEIAKESGLIRGMARALQPLLSRLFPDIPVDHPAMGAMLMNIAANMLGITNAATPFGLQAMKELQSLNPNKAIASNAMCTFLAINTSSVQLIPATAIAYLAANGNLQPTEVLFSSLCASLVSTIVAIVAVKQLAKLTPFRIKGM